MNCKKIGVVGLGAISNRHIESICNNNFFKLISVCDVNKKITDSVSKKLSVNGYYSIDDMIKNENLDIITILTPNGIHLENMISCINNGIDFIVEKPAALKKEDLINVIELSKKHNVNGYCVLQVRYNNTIKLLKKVLDKGIIGSIRSVSLVQRWQRPLEYFSGWRGLKDIGGGVLHEIGIHYLDVLQYVFGKPNVTSSSCYNTKHRGVDIDDTVYSILDFNGKFGGTCEITISAEPNNLECSISILGSNGFIKIGGKALNAVESYNFLSYKSKLDFEYILEEIKIDNKPNNYGSYEGSCPNHNIVYEMIQKNNAVTLKDSVNVISLIEDIYNKSNYYNCNNPLI
jgi:UDP-N-acetyl-2-amino-2-deoxyglucuronate dehydrogenase